MDNFIKLLALQNSEDACKELEKTFCEKDGFAVVAAVTDAMSAISLAAEKKPDVFVTELVLKGYDGLAVIDRIKNMNKGIKVVVLSSLCSEEAVKRSVNAGADYFVAKPFEEKTLKELVKNIRTATDAKGGQPNFRKVSLEEKISKIFINVGIPPHIKGYVFLREGVKMAVEDPNVINNITKKLYPTIGERYDTTPSKVERAIRHAIEVAWNRGRIENINNILGVRAYVGTDEPTNGEFIALIADKMLLEGMGEN